MAHYLSYLPTYLTDCLTNESALAAAAETRAVSMWQTDRQTLAWENGKIATAATTTTTTTG